MPENAYLNENSDLTYIYVIFKDDPANNDYGQYVFEPNNFQNQFPGKSVDAADEDLYSYLPATFGGIDGFSPYEYKVRRDITVKNNRRLYVSNIAYDIWSHKYARHNWTLNYYDDQCDIGSTDYDFTRMVNEEGTSGEVSTPFDYRNNFETTCNKELCKAPYMIDGKTKSELFPCYDTDCKWKNTGKTYSTVDFPDGRYCEDLNPNPWRTDALYWINDALSGAGSDYWEGKWTVGNHFGDGDGWSDHSDDLMSNANTSFKTYMVDTHSSMTWGGQTPLDVTAHGETWEKTQHFPLESPIATLPGARHAGTGVNDNGHVIAGLEGHRSITDLFSKTHSVDEPSIDGYWYIVVFQEADGWEWNLDSWKPGWREVSRDNRWQGFRIPKSDYIKYWFDLTDDYTLGRATGGSSNNPQDYTDTDHLGTNRTYIKHYEQYISWISSGARWTSATMLDTYVAIGAIPPDMSDLINIGGLFSQYNDNYMGWINPEVPHADSSGVFRFYNPFKDNAGNYYNLLDLTGVRKLDESPIRMEKHVSKLQKFHPIVKATVANGLYELQKYYTEGLDLGFEQSSAPAEIEFSVDIKSSKSFFPSDYFIVDNQTYTLEELKQEFGIEYKFFVADWGDDNYNQDGGLGGFPNNSSVFPQNASGLITLQNQDKFIVLNHQDTKRHTYYQEGIYTITSFIMCIKQRENNDVIEDQVFSMKKVETRIRIQKEFIFYPDYLHLGGGDFPIIPWISGTAPIISGISRKSDYIDSLRKILSSSTFLFSDAREAYLKGNTKSAYTNDELGEFLGKTDIDQIRVNLEPYDMNYMLGLSRLTYSSSNLRIEKGDCDYIDPITQENVAINDKIIGSLDEISFFLTLYSGQEIKIQGFINPINNNIQMFVDFVDISGTSPYISIRDCEVLESEGISEDPKTISNLNSDFVNNVVLTTIESEQPMCIGFDDNMQANNFCVTEYNNSIDEFGEGGTVGQSCGEDTNNDGLLDGICDFIEPYEKYIFYNYDNLEYWTGEEHSFSSESLTNYIFINESMRKILKDTCIIEYNFNDNDGITIRDSSGNQNNGVIIGDYGLLKIAENVPMGLGSSLKKPRVQNEDNDGVL